MVRRRNFIKKASSVANTAAKALAIATTVAGLINVEFKYADTVSTVNPSTSGAIVQLTNIAQGDTVTNRDGEEIKLKSIQSRWYCSKHTSATYTVVRMIWFIDKIGSTAPNLNTLLGTGWDINSPRNLDYRKRYIILKDVTLTFGDKTMAHGKWFKKLNLQTIWTSTGGADVSSGHLYFAYLSTEATNTPSLYITNRLRYLDN